MKQIAGRCVPASCPSIFEDGDKIIIVGNYVDNPPELLLNKIGNGETAVVIDRELFFEAYGILCQANASRVAGSSSEPKVPLQSGSESEK